VAYQTDDATDLTDENIEVRLNGETLNTKNSGSSFTWETYSQDVADKINLGETNTMEVYVEASVEGTRYEANVDNAELSVNVESIGESVADETGSGADTIFPLLVLIVIVTVFVMLIGVLRTLG